MTTSSSSSSSSSLSTTVIVLAPPPPPLPSINNVLSEVYLSSNGEFLVYMLVPNGDHALVVVRKVELKLSNSNPYHADFCYAGWLEWSKISEGFIDSLEPTPAKS
ncbi:hypothetical protein V9T40_003050 [Parthenolecanium corni]|uniref:Uncharacterized protein n=1 Tax=Parthenolecanium corni TaxID=536013 RepID=A0AAN9Y8I5_9HEMI